MWLLKLLQGQLNFILLFRKGALFVLNNFKILIASAVGQKFQSKVVRKWEISNYIKSLRLTSFFMESQCIYDISLKDKLRKTKSSNHAANRGFLFFSICSLTNYLRSQKCICTLILFLHAAKGLVSIVKNYQLINSIRGTRSQFVLNSSCRTLVFPVMLHITSLLFLIISCYVIF